MYATQANFSHLDSKDFHDRDIMQFFFKHDGDVHITCINCYKLDDPEHVSEELDQLKTEVYG